VALGVVATSHDPTWAWLAPPDVVEPIRACLHAVPGWVGAVYRRIERPFGLRVLRRAERRTLPGGGLHNALRKRWLEQEVRRGIATGISQVVVIGAGFDPLAWRLRDLPGVRCWEIDQPATQAIKRSGLSRLGPIGDKLHLIPADLAITPLDVVLAPAGFSARERTVFVAEGLLMYLTADAVTGLFRAMHRLLSAGGTVLGTAIQPLPDGRLGIAGAPRWVNWRLRLTGEPFRFGIAPDRLAGFVASLGFEGCRTVHPGEALREVAPPGAPREGAADLGEYLFRAETNGPGP
jgi:methyltransferase (TIGR00027 family)